MKQHTEQFNQEILKLGRQIHNVITYNNTILTNELYSVSVLFDGNILKSIMKELDVETSENIPEGAIINYQLGLKVGTEYEYLDYGNYIVYKNEILEDKKRYKLTCYDKMLYAMKQNEDLNVSYPITIKNYLNAIGSKIGLTVKDTSFNNQSINILEEKYVGLQYTYRDILDEIAQATGSMIIINADDEIEVKYPSNTGVTLNEQYFKDINVKFGQKYGPINAVVLSRSGGSDNIYLRDETSVAQNGLCEIKIEDNQLMNGNDRDSYLQGLLAAVDGLYYFINDYSSTGICYLEAGDIYTASIDNETYQCLMLNDEINIQGGIEELIHADSPEEGITDYDKADKTDRRLNQTYLIVDKQNQAIEAVVSNVSEQDQKIAQITLDYNELLSRISDISDITTSGESSYASVPLANVNTSQPITVKVHPIGSSIDYVYPYNTLYPSDTLYPKEPTLRFHNSTTSEDFDWPLPTSLWYYDANTYDELEMSYGDGTNSNVIVTRRCAISSSNVVSALETPTTETYEYPDWLVLSDGDYTVSLLGYNSAYLYVQLMAKNIYTTQFYTKAESNSLIEQTASSIDLSVNQKLSNYSTTSEMNAAIDIKANQITSTVSSTYATKATTNTLSSRIGQTAKAISLSVNNGSTTSGITITTTKEDGTTETATGTIQMNGLVSFTNLSTGGQTTINGANITTGIIKSSNYVSGSTGTSINLSNGVIDSAHFKVNAYGGVTADSAIISGQITAASGNIGGFTIGSTKLYNGKSSLTANSNGVYIGTDGISLGTGSTFKVTSNGTLTATSATISGNITATSGTIGGCTISNGTLTIKNANIESINGSKITGAGTLAGSIISSGSLVGSQLANNTITYGKIASVSASAIVAGTIHGCDLDGNNLTYNNVTVGKSGLDGHLQIRTYKYTRHGYRYYWYKWIHRAKL